MNYALTYNECRDAIIADGRTTTILLEGEPGIGKTHGSGRTLRTATWAVFPSPSSIWPTCRSGTR
jgi:hypothetical protein